MPVAGSDRRSRLMVTGSCSISRASWPIGGGIVALKNSVWRFGGQMPEDAPDVRQESHVEHAIGFVEHQILEAGELRVRRPKMIEQPARRRDDDVHAAAKRVLLRTHADAAKHRGAGDRRVHRQIGQVFDDLRRQLTRRRQDERTRHAARLRHQPVEDRQQERSGLAAAGHRAGKQIPALERRAESRRSEWVSAA